MDMDIYLTFSFSSSSGQIIPQEQTTRKNRDKRKRNKHSKTESSRRWPGVANPLTATRSSIFFFFFFFFFFLYIYFY
jgi:hypothetical protein